MASSRQNIGDLVSYFSGNKISLIINISSTIRYIEQKDFLVDYSLEHALIWLCLSVIIFSIFLLILARCSYLSQSILFNLFSPT